MKSTHKFLLKFLAMPLLTAGILLSTAGAVRADDVQAETDLSMADVNQAEDDLSMTDVNLAEDDPAVADATTDDASVTYYDSVTEGTMSEDGYYILKADSQAAIVSALAGAREYATEEQPYKIVVKPGTYTTTKTFFLGANTYLYAQDVKFVQSDDALQNMIRTYDDGYSHEGNAGYVNNNITIDGGVWDENGHSATLMKLALGSNITIKNATFKNTYDAHLCEAAGIQGLTFKNCIFKDQINDSKYLEAIQLDILVQEHFLAVRSEDVAMSDVTITGCTFSNVPRGVGSHTAVLNNPITNLKITNNKFKNNLSCAIQLLSVNTCVISGNTITNSPRGITVYGGVYKKQDTFLAKAVNQEALDDGYATTTTTSNAYHTPTNMHITISNNKITLDGSDPYAFYEKVGIWLCGMDGSKTAIASGSKLPLGDYYLTGATVKCNTVKGPGHGVKLEHARSVKVTGNTLTYSGGTGTEGSVSYYGIATRTTAKSFSFTSNKISGKYICGIYVKESSANDITKNNISGNVKYNISVEKGSAKNITSNTCSKATINGIHIWNSSKVTNILSNKISYAKNKGLFVGGKSSVTKIQKNTFKSCKQNLVISKDSKVKYK